MLLSICIPSYNRFAHIKEILSSINRCQSNEFEVVIIDNGSIENIYDEIIPDDYQMSLRIIKRNQLVSGISNPRDCVNYGKGKYRMLLLDKDFIDGDKLHIFLDFLKKNQYLLGGYCLLNASKTKEHEFYSRNDFRRIAFNIKHPSGIFVRRGILKKDNEVLDYLNPNSIYYDFPYIFDMCIARCIYFGRMCVYNAPLVKTETEDEAQKTKTHSYNEKNLYFSPDNKRKYIDIYMHNLNMYKLRKWEYNYIAVRLFKMAMYDSSIGYKTLLSNEKICNHYRIKSRKVSRGECLEEVKKTQKSIQRCSECKINYIEKWLISVLLYLNIYIKLYNK